ncbi:MAG: nucleoside 2-deoxyribosyltransferase [Arcticibacterium sp.]|jgi:nucleoside 2-deoxyribosyltransferase
MGIMPAPEKCYITDLETQNTPTTVDAKEYFVTVNGESRLFRFHQAHVNSEFVETHKHILFGLLLNDKLPYNPDEFLDNSLLEHAISQAWFPKTPEEKANSLLKYLYKHQPFDGGLVKLPEETPKEVLAKSLYFRNREEMNNYILVLYSQGYIDGKEANSKDGHYLVLIRFTFDGLSKVIQINEQASQSKRAFVAMSFSPDQRETRETIKNAIKECGYDPILIDEVRINSETTINDAMLSEIKQCKFLVADFTQLKNGVYFEAGYALGLGKPVIYLCRTSDFENAHFDTNHYAHILYDDLSFLKERLRDRINVWIN